MKNKKRMLGLSLGLVLVLLVVGYVISLDFFLFIEYSL